MKIILLQNVSKMGKKYDVKIVSDGHALNFLIPRGLAEVATDSTLKRVQTLKTAEESMRKVHNDLILKNLKDLEGLRVEAEEPANDKGHLFAGIHAAELAKIIKDKTELDITPEHIILDKPIKEVGEHEIELKIEDKKVKFKLVVNPKV
jgi:large subunit ribosomal protein L9